MKVGSLEGTWVPEEERAEFAALSLCHVRTARRQPYKPGKQISSRTKPASTGVSVFQARSHKSTPGWLGCSYDTAHQSLRNTQLAHRSRQLQKALEEGISHVMPCLWWGKGNTLQRWEGQSWELHPYFRLSTGQLWQELLSHLSQSQSFPTVAAQLLQPWIWRVNKKQMS